MLATGKMNKETLDEIRDENTRPNGQAMIQLLGEQIRDHPLRTMVIAVALGFVLGAVFSRR